MWFLVVISSSILKNIFYWHYLNWREKAIVVACRAGARSNLEQGVFSKVSITLFLLKGVLVFAIDLNFI